MNMNNCNNSNNFNCYNANKATINSGYEKQYKLGDMPTTEKEIQSNIMAGSIMLLIAEIRKANGEEMFSVTNDDIPKNIRDLLES